MVIVGIGGGILSFVNAVLNVKDALSGGKSCWTTLFDSEGSGNSNGTSYMQIYTYL